MEVLNNSLKECLKSIRTVCYSSYDKLLTKLINCLKEIPSISFYEDLKRDQFIVSLPLSSMKTHMLYPTEGSGISFAELLTTSNNSAKEYLEQSFHHFINILETSNKNFDKNKTLS